ncbi:hypothetical protein GCM10008018_33570 [Paenibacillus marchantiophytorum]|uniref:Uncharacterized protein n=1 Tax=Paenibacillus marchantiophytorum TaxID=1619310 RepID=A0ABQ1ES45_9BACL|nr:hypothetical protein GCM10008018_33570 [Paenibacillus marchantiophytorum]
MLADTGNGGMAAEPLVSQSLVSQSLVSQSLVSQPPVPRALVPPNPLISWSPDPVELPTT